MPKNQINRRPSKLADSTYFNSNHGNQPPIIKDAKVPAQAEVIIARFGGPMKLYRTLKEMYPDDHWTYTSIYRWLYPRSKGGTGGIIPNHAIIPLTKAARMHGFFLDYKDFFPEYQRTYEVKE